VIQVVRLDVRPPTTDPASADIAERYATSIVRPKEQRRI
jgi:hypothetical protein